MGEADENQRRTTYALLGLGLALGVWLWPIGLGGKMPVGGDVTQFSMGLMSVLHRALRSGRLPLWNDLWGYGFPGVGESQMGVFYPPHLILYGLLPTETAYTASLALHTIWGALGAFWAARRLQISPIGSALTGFAWSASGFFVIHLPHQWGYTTGCWMPWAWGLAWTLFRGEGTPRTPFLLAVVLTLQVLPGHFQLAFITQVSLALLAGARLVESRRLEPRRSGTTGVLASMLALAAVFPLAAAQLWPTLRLARLAATRRDFEYLSGFAATPLHLVSFVAPGLFHKSPLWRPLVWDPLHTAPEEHLAYIGLVPLFFAVVAIVHGARREPTVRILSAVFLATLILSLGPYVPVFPLLCRLPGFSFFRAPARWDLAASFALALLAGRGFDLWRTLLRSGRSLARFAVVAVFAPLLALLPVELAVHCTERPGWPVVAQAFDGALKSLPWTGDPRFNQLAATARSPQYGVDRGLAREGLRQPQSNDRIFVVNRAQIYQRELRETAVIILVLLAIALLATRRPKLATAALLVLTSVDLWVVGRRRAIDFAPIRPLEEQSPVLSRLARLPRGTRTVDNLGNLTMIAGAAPIAAYRTLDLPALVTLTRLARYPPELPEFHRSIRRALRVTGTGVRVLNPSERMSLTMDDVPKIDWATRETIIEDRALASWLNGESWIEGQKPWHSTFVVGEVAQHPARVWLLPLPWAGSSVLDSWSGDPEDVLKLLDRATPLELQTLSPERLKVELVAKGGEMVVLSQLADPQWRAVWSNDQGDRSAIIRPVLTLPPESGWQGVKVPGPGRWTLRLEYSGRDVYEGLTASALAWLAGALWYVKIGRGKAPIEGGRS